MIQVTEFANNAKWLHWVQESRIHEDPDGHTRSNGWSIAMYGTSLIYVSYGSMVESFGRWTAAPVEREEKLFVHDPLPEFSKISRFPTHADALTLADVIMLERMWPAFVKFVSDDRASLAHGQRMVTP